ncbi:hypothetical protein A2U01_0072608, partial [Trifolium medium]|nr:hypothetical protein [Trifolium medium]
IGDLVKDDRGCSHDVNVVDDGSEKANCDYVTEIAQETVAMTNAETSAAAKNVVPDTPEQVITPEKEKSPEQVMTGDVSTAVLSQFDESLKTVSENVEK